MGAQPDCKMQEQGHPGAVGLSVHFLPLPEPNPTPTPVLGWRLLDGTLAAATVPGRHARPGPALCFPALLPPCFLCPSLFLLPPLPSFLSLCLLSGLLPAYPSSLHPPAPPRRHDQGWNPCPLQRKLRALTTGPSGMSPSLFAFAMPFPLPPWQA